ncbi:MAG: hypothetical protein NXI22_17490, partial [bacterium]|nr:hypothetical protein [bacterium]
RVSESKSSRTFTCREEELQSVAAQPLVSDDELIQDVVLQTAEFRYSTRSQGLRRLVARKGFDPMRCLLVGCDQGDDVNVSLVLPDGTLVDADYREDPQTRQASEFTRWRTDSSTDRDIELCRQIIRGANLAELDSQVCRAFHSHFAATDRRLPAIE